ncbi:MAG: polyhydroxyalkanoate synthesis regulator DNA-binding domain-containing protein [Candidatus Sericytochromatia bacterium]
MRTIKRYENRKLYDTTTSKTLTLKDIATLIREGEEIKVVDNNDKDITNKVLAQIFLQENLSTKQMVMSKFLLEILIKESDRIENLTKKVLFAGVGLASLTQEKIENLVNELIKKGEVEEKDKNNLVAQIVDKVENGSKNFRSMVEGLVHENTPVKNEPKSQEEIIREKEKQIEELKRQIKELSEKNEVKEEEKSGKKSNLKVG